MRCKGEYAAIRCTFWKQGKIHKFCGYLFVVGAEQLLVTVFGWSYITHFSVIANTFNVCVVFLCQRESQTNNFAVLLGEELAAQYDCHRLHGRFETR